MTVRTRRVCIISRRIVGIFTILISIFIVRGIGGLIWPTVTFIQELGIVRCHVVGPFCIGIDSVQVTSTVSASIVSATYLAVAVYLHFRIVQHVSTLSTTIDRAFHEGIAID